MLKLKNYWVGPQTIEDVIENIPGKITRTIMFLKGKYKSKVFKIILLYNYTLGITFVIY